jgi:hypothetical protein
LRQWTGLADDAPLSASVDRRDQVHCGVAGVTRERHTVAMALARNDAQSG